MTPTFRFVRDSRSLLRLASPIILSQLAQILVGFLDTVMSGHAGAAEQAVVAIGVALWIPMFVGLSSTVQAVSPIIAHHVGARDHAAVVRDAREGIWLAALFGLVPLLLVPFAPAVLTFAGIEPYLAERTTVFLWGIGLGMPAALVYRSLAFYSASINQTLPIMVLSFVALGVNALLNWVLIYGHFGMPAMGGAGCGWATGIGMWVGAAAADRVDAPRRGLQALLPVARLGAADARRAAAPAAAGRADGRDGVRRGGGVREHRGAGRPLRRGAGRGPPDRAELRGDGVHAADGRVRGDHDPRRAIARRGRSPRARSAWHGPASRSASSIAALAIAPIILLRHPIAAVYSADARGPRAGRHAAAVRGVLAAVRRDPGLRARRVARLQDHADADGADAGRVLGRRRADRHLARLPRVSTASRCACSASGSGW